MPPVNGAGQGWESNFAPEDARKDEASQALRRAAKLSWITFEPA